MASLELKDKVNWDYFILLVAKTGMRFSELIKQLPEDKPIFVDGAVYNSTVNNILARHCRMQYTSNINSWFAAYACVFTAVYRRIYC